MKSMILLMILAMTAGCGGTMEPGESPQAAARREFVEETGLTPSQPLTHLVTQDYSYWKDGRTICHRRHYFHVALAGEQRQTFEFAHTRVVSFDDCTRSKRLDQYLGQ